MAQLKDTIVFGNLDVTKNLNLLGDLSLRTITSDQVHFLGNVAVSGVVSAGSLETAGLEVSVQNCKITSETVNILNDLNTDGRIIINKYSSATSTSTGSLVVAGGVGISESLYVGGTTNLQFLIAAAPANLNSTLNVTGSTILGSTLGVTGNTTIGGTLGVTGNTTIGGTLGVTGATTLSSTLTTSNTVTINKDTDCNSTNATASLKTTGGVYIAKSLYTGTNIVSNGNLTVKGTTALGDSTADETVISGNTAVGGTLGVTGATTLSNNLTVTGTTTLNGATNLGDATSDTVTVKGHTKLGAANLNIYSEAACSNSKFSVTASNGNTSISGTLGVTGATTLSSTLTVASTTTLNGTINLGNATGDTVTVKGNTKLGGASFEIYSEAACSNRKFLVTTAGAVEATSSITASGNVYGAKLGETSSKYRVWTTNTLQVSYDSTTKTLTISTGLANNATA